MQEFYDLHVVPNAAAITIVCSVVLPYLLLHLVLWGASLFQASPEAAKLLKILRNVSHYELTTSPEEEVCQSKFSPAMPSNILITKGARILQPGVLYYSPAGIQLVCNGSWIDVVCTTTGQSLIEGLGFLDRRRINSQVNTLFRRVQIANIQKKWDTFAATKGNVFFSEHIV